MPGPVVDQRQRVACSLNNRDVFRHAPGQSPDHQRTDAVIAAIGIADADDKRFRPLRSRLIMSDAPSV